MRIIQPRHGYRFAVDSVLLARFVRASSTDRVLELGAGCGVIAIALASLYHPRHVTALELQPGLAALAARNFALNGIGSARVLTADLRSKRIAGMVAGGFDLVVMNPPYRAARSGRVSPHAARRLARSEQTATLRDFVAAAARWTRHGGRVAAIFTAARSAELIAELRTHRLEPKRIRWVHPRLDQPASSLLIEARKGAGVEAAVEPPLILHARPGVYSEEARALLENR